MAEIEREKEAGMHKASYTVWSLIVCTEAERKRSRLAATAAGQAAMSEAVGEASSGQ